MFEDSFTNAYNKCKLMLYDKALDDSGKGENALTVQEVISMEIITALGEPTINEYISFAHLSASNAAYRIRQLESRGYVIRIRDEEDRREYHLKATDKYAKEYGAITDYMRLVGGRVRERFSPEDVAKLDEMLAVMAEELMPEVGAKLREHHK